MQRRRISLEEITVNIKAIVFYRLVAEVSEFQTSVASPSLRSLQFHTQWRSDSRFSITDSDHWQ